MQLRRLLKQRQLSLQQRYDRLIADSAEQREARLQEVSARQRERLATESEEERESTATTLLLSWLKPLHHIECGVASVS